MSFLTALTGAVGAVLWLVLAAVFVIAEGVTVQLVSIWFAAGALLATLAAAFGAPFWLQAVLFLASSLLVLALCRPMAKKMLEKRQPTNADRAIGAQALVIADIDNVAETGRVFVQGLDWSARSEDGEPIPKDSRVKILRIEGAKLIVEQVAAPLKISKQHNQEKEDVMY